MISTVRGRFAKSRNSSRATTRTTAKGSVEIVIDAASIDTREAQRDAHLRSADFFDVEKFPTMTFRSTRVEDASGRPFKLTGDLTIRGVTAKSRSTSRLRAR